MITSLPSSIECYHYVSDVFHLLCLSLKKKICLRLIHCVVYLGARLLVGYIRVYGNAGSLFACLTKI